MNDKSQEMPCRKDACTPLECGGVVEQSNDFMQNLVRHKAKAKDKSQRITWWQFFKEMWKMIKEGIYYKYSNIRGNIEFSIRGSGPGAHPPYGCGGVMMWVKDESSNNNQNQKEETMNINFMYDPEQEKIIVASKTEKIAMQIVASYTYNLTPGGEIWVSTTVSNTALYGWLRRKGCSILNRIFASGRMDKIIKDAMKKNNIIEFGWSIDKGIIGKYKSPHSDHVSDDYTWKITLNNTPIKVIEEISTELCKEFKQEAVLIHDLEKNTFKYWEA